MMEMRAQDPADALLARLRLDDDLGPAVPIEADAAAGIVQGALAAVLPTPAPRGGVGRGALLGGALALVLLGGGLALRPWRSQPETRPETKAATVAAPVTAVAAQAPAPVPAPVAAPITAPAPAPAPAAVAPAPATASRPRRASETAAARDLLRLANQHRGARRFREADAVYQEVLRRAPGGDAAYVATVASAELRLEHLRDARAAVALYRQALRQRPAGSLALEAHRGLAEGLRALGDRDGERAALRALLDAGPDPDTRAAAQARLRALGG